MAQREATMLLEPLQKSATDLDHLLLTLQAYKNYQTMSNADLARKAITRYERGVRNLQEEFDEVDEILSEQQH